MNKKASPGMNDTHHQLLRGVYATQTVTAALRNQSTKSKMQYRTCKRDDNV